jgi:hypothetical protein
VLTVNAVLTLHLMALGSSYVYGVLGLVRQNKEHLHTGVQALQALSRSTFSRDLAIVKGHKTDDDMVFMNIAWAENTALRVPDVAYLLFELCIYASGIVP